MSEPRIGSRYELQVARQGMKESKAANDYFAVHPGDVEEIEDEEKTTSLATCTRTRSAARWTAPACASSAF